MSEVRIIGGQWKRTPIHVPDALGLRPTPNRVRETLFNWLGPSLQGWRVLDLFAGSGALGFEAASRGASDVVLVDNNRQAVAAMQALATKLNASQMKVMQGDAIQYLQRAEPFDLILLDPPFDQGWLDKVAPAVLARLRPHGMIYVEDREEHAAWPGTVLRKHQRAGVVHYHLLQLQES